MNILFCAVIHPGGPDVSEFECPWMVEHLGFGPVSWDKLVSTVTTESRRGGINEKYSSSSVCVTSCCPLELSGKLDWVDQIQGGI